MARRVLVTGAAGFIGSHLAQACLERGDIVVGLDCLSSYYSPEMKRDNLCNLSSYHGFEFIEGDLLRVDLSAVLDGVDSIFHLAGQPGVRASWGQHFRDYSDNNVLATQRVLESARRSGTVKRFVFASSSSVYGQSSEYPSREESVLAPHSPYGVTKLAAENLVSLYAANWGLSTVSLRYFTVYGPRQRPDMAISRLLRSALRGDEFTLFGDGTAVRDFTYVSDVVAANIKAATVDLKPGTTINISGGDSVDMRTLVATATNVIGASPRIVEVDTQRGDVQRTGADVSRAFSLLDWSPSVTLEVGLKQQSVWLRDLVDRKPHCLSFDASD